MHDSHKFCFDKYEYKFIYWGRISQRSSWPCGRPACRIVASTTPAIGTVAPRDAGKS